MTFLEIYNLSIREHVNVANDFLYKKNLAKFQDAIITASELQKLRGRSSTVRAASLYLVLAPDKCEVVGSNPAAPTNH